MQWDLKSVDTLLETRPFRVQRLNMSLTESGEDSDPYYRLDCPDFVNVLPITSDGQAVLIRQSRAGSWRDELEIPAGVMEAGERDATMTAARELEEETGYVSQRFLALGKSRPNPAIMTNEMHMFLALGCTPATSRQHFPDKNERISLELYPVAELEELVRRGQIANSLCALSVLLALKYLNR